MIENLNREEELFALALEKPAEKRAALLDAMCDGDVTLRAGLDVLLAAHEQPDPTLAATTVEARPTIKLDLADAPDEAVGQTLAMMDHPNTAKVLDAGTTDVCRSYFVMELVRSIRISESFDPIHHPHQQQFP